MDPFSVAGGIVGLLGLTIQIAQLSCEYLSSARRAVNSIKDLYEELLGLHQILTNIYQKIVLNADFRIALQPGGSTVLDLFNRGDLQRCQQDLEYIQNKLIRKSSTKTSKIKEILVWPFTEQSTIESVRKIHRHQDIFQAAISIDALALDIVTNQSVLKTGADLKNVHEDIVELRKEVYDWRNAEKYAAILKWLSPLDFLTKQQDILSKKTAGTCQWLLDHPRYVSWKAVNGVNRTLWCPGEPGAGKSVASAVVISDLLDLHATDSEAAVVYAFCDYNAHREQTVSALLASLLVQITQTYAKFPQELERLYKPDASPPKTAQCADLLVAICGPLSRVFIVIDAVDELSIANPRQRKEFVEHLLTLQRKCPSVSVFATGRPHLEEINRLFSFGATVTIRAQDNDIRMLVAARLDSDEDLQDIWEGHPNFRDELFSTIVEKAGGQFLLPALYINRLGDMTSLSQVKKSLLEMSSSITGEYERALERINMRSPQRRTLAMDTLMWLSHVTRPLRMEELQEALAAKADAQGIDRESLPPQRIILESCLGLVKHEEQSREVRLVHFTLEEYLSQNAEVFAKPNAMICRKLLALLCCDAGLERRTVGWDGVNGTGLGAEKFRTIVTLDDVFQSPRRRLTNFNGDCLYPYAFQNWQKHARQSNGDVDAELLQYIATRPPWISVPKCGRPWDPDLTSRYIDTAGPLDLSNKGAMAIFYATLLGLPSLLDSLTSKPSLATHNGSSGSVSVILTALLSFDTFLRYPIEAAVTARIDQAILILLDQDCCVQDYSSRDAAALAYLLPRCSFNIIRKVIDAGFDINRKHGELPNRQGLRSYDGFTTLHHAVVYSCPKAVMYLIDQGAEINTCDAGGFSVLTVARRCRTFRSPEIEECLLEAGADPGLGIPFHVRSYGEQVPWQGPRQIRMLIDAGESVQNIRFKERTALVSIFNFLTSIFLGNDDELESWDAAQLLLNHGASLDDDLPQRKCELEMKKDCVCFWQTMLDLLDPAPIDLESDLAATRRRAFRTQYRKWFDAENCESPFYTYTACNQIHRRVPASSISPIV